MSLPLGVAAVDNAIEIHSGFRSILWQATKNMNIQSMSNEKRVLCSKKAIKVTCFKFCIVSFVSRELYMSQDKIKYLSDPKASLKLHYWNI